MSSVIGFRVLQQMIPENLGAFLERKLKLSGDTAVDAETLRSILPNIGPRDPSRAVVKRFIASLEATDELVAAAAEANVEVGSLAAFHMRKSGAEDAPAIRDLGEGEALVDLWSTKQPPSPATELPPAEEGGEPTFHPLDAALADLLAPPPGFVDTVCDVMSVRLFDRAWAQAGPAKTATKKLAAADVPVFESIFETGAAPGAIVFDKLGGPLDEAVKKHSWSGRRPLVAVATTKTPLTEDQQAHLLELGVTEVVHWRAGDAKALTAQIKEKVDGYATAESEKLETAVGASGQAVASSAWWAAAGPLGAALGGSTGSILLQAGARGEDAAWVAPFSESLTGETSTVYQATTKTDITKYLSEASGGTLVITDADKLTPEAQQAVKAHLLATTHPTTPRAQRIVCTTNVGLSHAIACGSFDPELAQILGASTLYLPNLRMRPSELVDITKEMLGRAYEDASVAAVKSLDDPEVATYLTERLSDDWGALRGLVGSLAAEHDPGTPITAEILAQKDPGTAARKDLVDKIVAEMFDEAPDVRSRIDIGRVAEAAQSGRTIVTVGFAEQIEEITEIVRHAAQALHPEDAEGEPSQVIQVDQIDMQSVEELAAAWTEGANANQTLVLVDFVYQPDDARAALLEKLDAAQADGNVKSVVFISSAVPPGPTPAWASMGAEAPIHFAQITSNSDVDAEVDAAMVARPKRKAAPDPAELEAERLAAEAATREDAARMIEDRAGRGLAFEGLREGQDEAFLTKMDKKMWGVRYEQWPDQIEAKAAAGQNFDSLLAQYKEAAAGLGKPVDTARVDGAKKALASTRLEKWPNQIRERVAAGEHFDDLIAQYHEAAKAAGVGVDEEFLNGLIDTLRANVAGRAKEGADFDVYLAEYKAAADRVGKTVSKLWIASQETKVFETRADQWPAKIQEKATAGEPFDTLVEQLQEALKELDRDPIDPDWLKAREQELKAAQG